jgi:hypothetical protein
MSVCKYSHKGHNPELNPGLNSVNKSVGLYDYLLIKFGYLMKVNKLK